MVFVIIVEIESSGGNVVIEHGDDDNDKDKNETPSGWW